MQVKVLYYALDVQLKKQKVKPFVSKKVLTFIKENTLDKKQDDAYILYSYTEMTDSLYDQNSTKIYLQRTYRTFLLLSSGH